MADTLEQLHIERIEQERRTRRRVTLGGAAILAIVLAVGLLILSVKLSAHRAVAAPRTIKPPVASAETPQAPVRDPDTEQTLQRATGLAASLLASTRDTEVARSALVAAQKMTGCAPEEGGPALVHLDNAMEKAAELASRADFYATARQNGRTYATHARAYIDSRTVVYVAVAWECPSAL